MKPLFILRAGDPLPAVAEVRGFYPAWIRSAVGDSWPHTWAEHDAREDAPLPALASASAFILTGSSHSVTERLPWMLRLEQFVRDAIAREIPLFGICFGHQLIAHALGGTVEKNPRGREIGTITVRRLDDDPIFTSIPPTFDANATHVDTVTSLPQSARLLADSRLDRSQAYGVGRNTRCVLFHPEIDGDAMRRFIAIRAPLIESEGGDPIALQSAAKDAPLGAQVLRNFVEHFAAR